MPNRQGFSCRGIPIIGSLCIIYHIGLLSSGTSFADRNEDNNYILTTYTGGDISDV